MSTVRLTPTSYVVLGLLERLEPATPYDLKRAAQLGVSNLWYLPHAQLYVEPARLAQAGLLDEQQEPGGRRRKRYTLTGQGRRVLDDWRNAPTAEPTELRDPGLLKLFFGAPPGPLAEAQLQAHRQQLDSYKHRPADLPEGVGLALEAGIGHEREWTRFWTRVAKQAKKSTAEQA
jgi:DNA-binding PadR family transcriptional regulator